MSGSIWLITEDENDVNIVRAILQKKSFKVKVKPLLVNGGSGGISRLRTQLVNLIKTAKAQMSSNDCIAVLHDLDSHKQPKRQTYDEIRDICKSDQVKYITANDEIESWLLSDAGIAAWLEIKHENWDERKSPSESLGSKLNSNYKINYRGRYREQVLVHLDGNILSPSFQKALKHLENAPCVKAE
ncbi:MAG: hypothetical protein LCI00_14155 [Chloroflexi bacterium]|nr:hypothetical protein [Chloroflexota bacterium]MCC6896845.1 hypothetical protein [Anaerolineae bacterium]